MLFQFSLFLFLVEGGQRAIIFSRLGGIQEDIMTEGLHFRMPWFQYPLIYDIRSRPRKITSPTGSKDLQVNFGRDTKEHDLPNIKYISENKLLQLIDL
jgi:hypothetical protein